jgi:FdhD protein
VTGIDYDDELEVVVVRTAAHPLRGEGAKKTRTSGCAVGTVFGDMMEGLEGLTLPPAEVCAPAGSMRWPARSTPPLALSGGRRDPRHGAVPARPVLVYMEDVGRHNAVDKIAGWMFRHGEAGADKILYTTGRLTSEMVIKTR